MEICVENKSVRKLLPVLFAFFVMGFVDVVGISTSYVKNDFGLNDTLANLLPMMVFLWFAVCSLPTGLLMGHIGRKKTVLLSALITGIAMLLPFIYYSFVSVLMAFALLGIGNTILQVSLNPLLLDVVSKDKVTSMLTLGQFIKAISSTLGYGILFPLMLLLLHSEIQCFEQIGILCMFTIQIQFYYIPFPFGQSHFKCMPYCSFYSGGRRFVQAGNLKI